MTAPTLDASEATSVTQRLTAQLNFICCSDSDTLIHRSAGTLIMETESLIQTDL